MDSIKWKWGNLFKRFYQFIILYLIICYTRVQKSYLMVNDQWINNQWIDIISYSMIGERESIHLPYPRAFHNKHTYFNPFYYLYNIELHIICIMISILMSYNIIYGLILYIIMFCVIAFWQSKRCLIDICLKYISKL